MQDVHGGDAAFARQCVDDDFADGSAIGEVVERPAPGFFAAVVNFGCPVKARGRKLYPCEIGELHQFGKGQLLIAGDHSAVRKLDTLRIHIEMMGCKGDQPTLEGVGGIQRGHGVEVCTGRCGCRGGIGHLVSPGRRDLDIVDRQRKGVTHDLGNLDEKALSHLGPAMVEMDTAVSIDVQERACLVEPGGREGNAELDRRERKTSHHQRICCIRLANRVAPCPVMTALLQFFNNLIQYKVVDLHEVGRDVAVSTAVKVALAYRQRIKTCGAGNALDNAFTRQHALGAAKTPKRGVGNRVGEGPLGPDIHGGEIVSVVDMKHGAVIDRIRQIERTTAARGEMAVDRKDLSLVIVTHLPVKPEVVPFAGQTHVIVAVQSAFNGVTAA